jgi:hypothetical protein
MNKKKLKKRIKKLEDENVSFGVKTMLAYVEIEELKEQLLIQRVTFCLPIEGDTFISWHSRHFKLQIDGSVVAIKNETIKYTQDQMLELWNFLTDRLLAN